MSEQKLIPGAFYWVIPEWDVDFTPPGFEGKEYSEELHAALAAHWSTQEQPALFNGYDENGHEKWTYLGHEDDRNLWWPARWVGAEIIRSLR